MSNYAEVEEVARLEKTLSDKKEKKERMKIQNSYTRTHLKEINYISTDN